MAATVPPPRRTPRAVNVGRNPTAAHAAADVTFALQDRVERLKQENERLKIERNEQDQLLKDLKTKFRRLTRDLKANGTDVDALLGGGAAGAAPPPSLSSSSLPRARSKGTAAGEEKGGHDRGNASLGEPATALVAKLALVTSQRDQLRDELHEARRRLELHPHGGARASGGPSGHAEPVSVQAVLLGRQQQQQQHQQHQQAARGAPRSPPRGGAPGPASSDALLSNALSEIDALRRRNADLEAHVRRLEGENDALQVQSRRGASGGAVPLSLSRPGSPQGGSIYAATGAEGASGAPYFDRLQGAVQSQGTAAAPLQQQQQQQQQRLGLVAERRAEAEVQRLREKVLADAVELDALTRERDMLRVQAQRFHNDPHGANDTGSGNVGVDPQTMIELQRGIHDKSIQLTVLTNKFTHAQGQVRMLQAECDRLVEELRAAHTRNSDVTRNLFELEQQKFQMQVKCDRVGELEAKVGMQAEELRKCETELLRMVDKLQSTARETEVAVRKEFTGRTAELEVMREQAESERRQKDRENFAMRQEVSELKRHVDLLKEDALMYKKEIERLQDEKQELQRRSALLGEAGVAVDDDVHKAISLVGLKKKTAAAVDVGALWEGLDWGDGWELSKMREAVAQAALDLELAETRCGQLKDAADSKDSLLREISAERDVLLDENCELRRRISGIQTTFVKQVLNNNNNGGGGGGDEAVDAGSCTGDGGFASASVQVEVFRIACDPDIATLEDGTKFAPTLFLTLDAFEDFETVISEVFYCLEGPLSARFRFDGIPITPSTLEMLQRTSFVLQLHQSYGIESDVAAVGSFPASQLLRCRDGSQLVLSVPLFDANGGSIGAVDVRITVSNVFVAFLLDRPLQGGTLSADQVRAALMKFRGVQGLRIVVRSAAGLLDRPLPPCPYVFYTCTAPTTAFNFIADTTVSTPGRAVTADPQFGGEHTMMDHKCVVDREFVCFVQSAVVNFIVFDHRATDASSNLGVAAVPLAKLLTSPTATIVTTEALHPQGTLSIEMAWIR